MKLTKDRVLEIRDNPDPISGEEAQALANMLLFAAEALETEKRLRETAFQKSVIDRLERLETKIDRAQQDLDACFEDPDPQPTPVVYHPQPTRTSSGWRTDYDDEIPF